MGLCRSIRDSIEMSVGTSSDDNGVCRYAESFVHVKETGVGVGAGAFVGAGRGGVVARDSDRLSRLRDLPVLPFDACDEGIANIMKWMAGAPLSECLIAAVEYC